VTCSRSKKKCFQNNQPSHSHSLSVTLALSHSPCHSNCRTKREAEEREAEFQRKEDQKAAEAAVRAEYVAETQARLAAQQQAKEQQVEQQEKERRERLAAQQQVIDTAQESAQAAFILNVQIVNQGKVELVLPDRELTTIAQVKAMVAREKPDMVVERQLVISSGRRLENDGTLRQYRIVSRSTIHIGLKTAAAPSPSSSSSSSSSAAAAGALASGAAHGSNNASVGGIRSRSKDDIVQSAVAAFSRIKS